jgi:hypothetical protein
VRVVLTGRRPLLRRDIQISGHDGPLLIDARRLTFLSPLDLTGLAVLAHAHPERSEVRLLLPSDANIASYIDRMDLLTHLPAGCTVLGLASRGGRSDRSGTLLEVTRVADATDAERACARVASLARQRFGPATAHAVFTALGELLDNAITHGASAVGVYVAAQTYTGVTSRQPGLEFAVCDAGDGVLAHLRGNPPYARFRHPATALRYALQPGVTGTRDRRGYGLPDTVNQAGRNGLAHLALRTDDALARITVRRARWRQQIDTSRTPVGGTWAWMRVNTP